MTLCLIAESIIIQWLGSRNVKGIKDLVQWAKWWHIFPTDTGMLGSPFQLPYRAQWAAIVVKMYLFHPLTCSYRQLGDLLLYIFTPATTLISSFAVLLLIGARASSAFSWVLRSVH